ncbi:aldehyde dehydrogenase (NADP(+)) [Microbacterium sp. A82]|uniref:aldehyde dehydrogenase (NADP(+)) n=1 Tax=unclassified Microbacterium TaxID=2609290 RepID=UPI003F3A7B01
MTNPQNLTDDTTLDEVQHAAEAAASAFAVMSRSDEPTRATWLRAIADRLDAEADELTAIANEETALGLPRLTGEFARTTAQLRLFASVVEEGSYLEAAIDHPNPTATPPIPDLRRILRPIGPVAVFAASNFPFAFSVAGGDTASSLAVGCPVLLKAHPGHPRTSVATAAAVADALATAGAPAGAFSLITGFDAGLALASHPAVRAVAFTGSVRGGRALLDHVTARPEPIPFYGELGAVNPVVITAAAAAARSDELAAGLADSFQLGVGQFCTKPGLVFVPAGSSLPQQLAELLRAQPRMLTPTIAEGFAHRLSSISAVPGVDIIASDASGPTVAVTDAATLLGHADQLLEEVFGPFTLLVRIDESDDLTAVLRALPGTLTATVHHEPAEDVEELVSALSDIAGRVLFNGWPTGVAVSWAQHHGGPWPSTNTQFTSVGAAAVRRFQRPIVFQNAPEQVLPRALHEQNPLRIPRRVDGVLTVADSV